MPITITFVNYNYITFNANYNYITFNANYNYITFNEFSRENVDGNYNYFC